MRYGNSIVGCNPYRAGIIKENLEAMKKDGYAIARLHGATDNINIINIDEPELEILLAFYEGKEIIIKEDSNNETDDEE